MERVHRETVDIEVARDDLSRLRILRGVPQPLQAGQARIALGRFGFSTNNVSYAVYGDQMGYWRFFPAGPAQAGEHVAWGRIPVWGFGDVIESRSLDLEEGERLFGLFSMSTELVIDVGRADASGVSDVAVHRQELAGPYNRYRRCRADPHYRAGREELHMLLYPLFFTAFLIDDFLVEQADFGATQLVVSSASAKTSIALAFLAHDRGRRVVGLTSGANAGFARSLEVYDQVVAYEAAGTLAEEPSVFVDLAGNLDVRRAVHERLERSLAHSMAVGETHWDHQPSLAPGSLPGPVPKFFFAPRQVAARTVEWGPEELDRRLGAAWDRFCAWVPRWLRVRQVAGAEAVGEAYQATLGGRLDPRVGTICTLGPPAGSGPGAALSGRQAG